MHFPLHTSLFLRVANMLSQFKGAVSLQVQLQCHWAGDHLVRGDGEAECFIGLLIGRGAFCVGVSSLLEAQLIGSDRAPKKMAVNIHYEAIFVQGPMYLSDLTEDVLRDVLNLETQ